MSVTSSVVWFNQRMSSVRSRWPHSTPLVLFLTFVVHFAIVLFRSICPLCSLFLLVQLISLAFPRFLPVFSTSLPSLVRGPLTVWCACELWFFFYLWHRSRVLQKRRAPPPLSKEYREIFIRRVLIAICMVAREDEKSALVGDDDMIARAKEHAKQSPPLSSSAISLLSSPSGQSPTSPRSPSSRSLPSVPSATLPAPGPLLPSLTAQQVHRRFSLSQRVFDIRRILQGWFFNAPLDEIYEENIVQWLCFGLFHRDEGEMTERERKEMRKLWGFLKRGGRSKEELEQDRIEEENHLFYPSNPHISRVASAVPVLGRRPTASIKDSAPPAMRRSYSDATDVEAAALRSALPPPVSVQIHPGFNPNTRCMRVIIDPFHYLHRPLMLYGFVYAVHRLFGLYLTAGCGYRYYSFPSLKYYHRPPADPAARVKSTLVFVHGISNGLSSYSRFVHRLNHSGNRHMFLIVLPFVSMNVVEHVPTAKDTVEALKTAFIRHTSPDPTASPPARPPKVIFVGHSYGSLLASWFVKCYPHMLLSVVLIDPICFLLFTPHLCFNFLYRPPVSPMHHMLNFFVARELFIAHTLHRHFFWTVNVLWVEDLTYIGEEEAADTESEQQRKERQKGENWQESDTTNDEHGDRKDDAEADEIDERARQYNGVHRRKRSLPEGSHKAVDEHDDDGTPPNARSKSTRPIVAAPELLPNAVLSPLLRAPCTLARLPPISKHPTSPAPSKCFVFLSELDDIIYAPPVHHYLTESTRRMMDTQLERRWRERSRPESQRAGKADVVRRLCDGVCQVKMWHNFRHAQFLLSTHAQAEVMQAVDAAEGLCVEDE